MSAVSPTARHPGATRTSRLDLSPSGAAFAGLLALGAILVLVQTRNLSFFGDDWDFVLDRRGLSPHVLLTPHGPHLSLIPILTYKLLLQVFGSSYLPFRLLAALDLVLIAYVLGRVCRAKWGRWWGLAPVLLLVTLGQGGVTLLWSFQVGYALALAAGVIALLAVQRDETWADVLACGMLLLSLASASQGIGFTVGVAVMLVLRHGWRRRAWVVVVPAVLYGLWYLKYGHQYSETHLSLWKGSLTHVMQTLSATLGALVGLSQVTPQTGTLDITFGVPLALGTVAAIAYAAWRGWRPRRLFWGAATTFLVVVVATSLSNSNGLRPPNDPRYLPPDAMLLLICLCAGAPRPRLARAGTIAACVVLAIVSATNAAQYDQQRTSLHGSDVISRAEIGATDILRGIVPPAFTPEQPGDPGVVVNVQAGPLFSAEDAFGPFGSTPATLLKQSEDTRQRADVVLRSGESLALSPAVNPGVGKTTPPGVLSGQARTDRGCVILTSGSVDIRTPIGTFLITAPSSGPVTVMVGRFATGYPIALGSVAPGTTAAVRVPADRAPQVPWRMSLGGPGGRVCAIGG